MGIVPGDGLVARFRDTVMYVGDTSPSVAHMLAVVETHADSKNPGAAIAERLGTLTFGEHTVRTPFGVVAPTADGLLVLLRGKVTAEFETDDAVRTLSGVRALTWVDEVLPDSVQRVAVTREGAAPGRSDPHTDLRAGVVPGGGFVLCSATAARGAQPVTAESLQTQQPTDEWSALDATAGPVTQPHSAPIPIVRSLESEDGAVYPLDRDYVIGRDPLRDEAVRNATASPIVVRDDRHISRVHAYISIRGDAVTVRDAATPAGTFISSPCADNWTRIGTAPTELEPGWRLRVGEHILTYHR